MGKEIPVIKAKLECKSCLSLFEFGMRSPTKTQSVISQESFVDYKKIHLPVR